MSARGTVHLVGAGPGAPDLLTVRAARLLGEADIVFHDALIHPEVIALSSGIKVPVGKRSGRHSTAQRFINKQLADAARVHRTVVRLKGGDPMLFGRAHEEIAYLQALGVAVEVVPGVTAALAASADLRVSLTRRGLSRSVTFVTPRVGAGERDSSWVAAVLAADTAAIYMGAGEAQAISAALIGAGMSPATPVAVVESASLPGTTCSFGVLADLPRLAASSGGPMLILLGEVYAAAAQAAYEVRRSASQSA
ncbi:MAG TPA: uroporphyrinogen-III C-methyltransferase [Burkholderiales bacterium]|nr:uroporphyrinogen-III C-methyltransferase [Burkholderiales bacterium]